MTNERHTTARRRARRLVSTSAALVVLVAAGACGGDGDDDGGELSADERRYCELTDELDAKGEAAFADITEESSEEDIAATEKAFVESADAEFDELVEVAPAEIEEEVADYVAGFRARAAGEDSNADDAPLVEWEEENCPA